jgi:alkylation response protein AidB-like acyl-CoA dehydrogenase
VRAVCDAKVAPRAAEADDTGEFPKASYEALRAADFHAPHIPVDYGGVGANALATAIVIEEVARACASSSLIPAVNKLGTMPLLLTGSEELKRRYLAPVARGEAMFSYCLSEPEAGSDAATMTTRAIRDGDHYVLNGVKRWITNAGISENYTVFAVTDPSAGSRGISAFVVERSDAGVSFGAPERKLGIKGVAHPRGLPRPRTDSGRPDDRRSGHRFRDRDAHARSHSRDDRRSGRRHRPGRARLRQGVRP